MVWFLNTVRVSCSSLGGGEFGEHHRLVENLDRFVHGGQFEHGSFREVAAFGCLPFVMLLDQDRPGKTQQGRRVGEHADDVGATFDLLVDPFEWVRRPDLPPVAVGESGEGEQIRLGVSEHPGDLRVGAAEHGGDSGELLLNVFRIGLGEDGADD